MDQKINFMFLILLASKSFSLTTQQHSPNYDITETLQTAINRIVHNLDPHTMREIICQSEPTPYDFIFNATDGSKSCTFNMAQMNPSISLTLHSDFITKETRINVRSYSSMLQNLNHDQDAKLTIFSLAKYKDISIVIHARSKNNENISIEFPPYSDDDQFFLLNKHNSFLPISDDERLIRSLKKQLRSMILQHIIVEFCKNISRGLEHDTRNIFTSFDPDFFKDPQRYFYLVPNASYVCFNLRNITIRGLTNFVSLNKTEETIDNFGITLLIENIRGEMILDYGITIEKPMQLVFLADNVFIRVDQSNLRINVEIQNYRVFRTGLNISLTDQQSAIIIQHIESAIASSLMPSMSVWRTNDQLTKLYDLQCPFGKMVCEMVNSDWKPAKRLLNKWIPFNEDETNTTNLGPTPKNHRNQTESNQYDISFQNITIKLFSNNSKEIQCEFPNNLKMIHQITATPIQKIHWNWNSNKGSDIEIIYHVNFTSINFSQMKLNKSSSNDVCELQLDNNENIKVELTPKKIPNEDTDSELKKKIDSALISTAKERFIRNVKQTVCLPFEICTQAAKIVDDFILQFIDKVLKKCSLRRNKINHRRT